MRNECSMLILQLQLEIFHFFVCFFFTALTPSKGWRKILQKAFIAFQGIRKTLVILSLPKCKMNLKAIRGQ